MRALLVGLCAFALAIQAAAAATKADSIPATRPSAKVAQNQEPARTLEQRLARSRAVARKYRGTIRFYKNHRQLFSTGEQRRNAAAKLQYAKKRVAQSERTIARLERAVARREARRLAALPPRKAICTVFGRYCGQAVNVAWCESRLTTTARNGQYLGLFQMGSYERRLFGHGSSAHAQSVAAHRYFVLSGRDWSPWGCRWAAS